MLTAVERERLDLYFPRVTFWMRFHIFFWSSLTFAAIVLVLFFISAGKAQASIPGWIILSIAVLGVGVIPVYLYFLKQKKRDAFRREVIAVGPGVIYRTEGYDLRQETVLLNEIIRPLAKKDLLPLIAGMLSPITGPLPDIPDWVSATFHFEPYVQTRWNDKMLKARGFCEAHKYLLVSNTGSLETMQALLLHEAAHAVLSENFPRMESAEQERIIRESHIERTDLLGLT